MRRRSFMLGASAATLVSPPAIIGARAADGLKISAFAGASNLPIWAGETKGFLATQGVEPTLQITPNSTQLARDLLAGTIDLALTSIDNIVAYDEGQGEVDLGAPANFVALFGVDNGMLHLMADKSINDVPSLKGKLLSVDAMTTGYAFVLREMLARNGVKEADVQWAKVGGGAQRLEGLLKGEQIATLLNSPLDLIAEARGFKRLLSARDMLGAYQGICAATTRDMLGRKAREIAAFTRGLYASIAWLGDTANREEAVGLLMTRMKGMERPAAEKSYDKLLDRKDGIYRDLKIDMAGLKTVLELRSRYASPPKPLTDSNKYIDAGFLAAALK
jgi:ABC-type nitrate/sulfonate/bicarbonate transport system substrate-binding protein